MERIIKIAPSLLAADFLCLKDDVKNVETAGVEYLHFDIMDGHFVPNITFGPSLVKSLRPLSGLIFDVHLMIEKPERYIKEFVDAGADIITVHAEACIHLDRTLQMIRDLGAKSCVALNPATHHSVLDYVWNKLDMVLLMSVNPGFGGQQFIQSVLRKSYEIYSRINEMSCNIDIEIDGGICPDNAKQVVQAGCNVLVAGTSIFGKKTVARSVKNIRDMAMEGL
jgi:ribulose-phosphate 3-epimerase